MLNLLIGLSGGTSAYIDPAATSILITSITSVAVAVGAVFIILWRKFKKGARKVLHIDENAGKEVEDDLVILDDSIKEDTESEGEQQATENPEAEKPASETAEVETAEVEAEPTNADSETNGTAE